MKKTIILGLVLSLALAALTATAQQTAPTPAPAPAEAAMTPATGLTIARMEFAGSVMDRKPVDVADSFPATTEKVFCYLEFKDVKNETAVNVVWKLGDKEMGKTQLTIKPYPKFRTWANKSLYGMKGDWKADVLDEKGNVLKSAAFTVQ